MRGCRCAPLLASESNLPCAVCGNAIVEGDETCDDGNPTANDGCTACRIDPGYSCPTAGAACIQQERCGDGVVDLDLKEECDDGNTTPGDGCGALCKFEPNYTCPKAGQLCTSTIVCGDGLIAGSEQCDDGNKLSSDGCSATCVVEAGWLCPVAATRCVAKMYGITLFQAERHTSGSNYKLTLNGFVHAISQCKSKCGDGIVAGDEVCDDGKNDGSYGSCAADC